MFVHITVNTFTGKEVGDGTESPGIFNPEKLDARQWTGAAKSGGFRSMILTAKHHDGFCLWPTKTTEHSVRHSPWRGGKGDVVREFTDACRAEGLGAGIYLSPWDRNSPVYGQGQAYNDFYIAQLEELLSNYGQLGEIWLDGHNGEGPNGKHQDYDWPRINATIRRLQPNAVILSDVGPDARWIGNENGSADTTCWSTIDPARPPSPGMAEPWVGETLMQGDPLGTVWRPGESDVSIRPGWFWHAEQDDQVRDGKDLMRLYFRSVGRNGKLLLNVPPTKEGLFHPNDVLALAEFDAKRTALFAKNLLGGARVKTSAGEHARSVAGEDSTQYWKVPSGEREAWMQFDLSEPIDFDVVRIEEGIELGQNIAGHRVEVWHDGGWRTVARGTTVGNVRLQHCPLTSASRVRVVIEFAYGSPVLRRLALYRWPSPGSA